MHLREKVAGICKKNLHMRSRVKMSVSLITDYFNDQRIEIINSRVEFPNASRSPA
jgi:hypothetical protein